MSIKKIALQGGYTGKIEVLRGLVPLPTRRELGLTAGASHKNGSRYGLTFAAIVGNSGHRTTTTEQPTSINSPAGSLPFGGAASPPLRGVGGIIK